MGQRAGRPGEVNLAWNRKGRRDGGGLSGSTAAGTLTLVGQFVAEPFPALLEPRVEAG